MNDYHVHTALCGHAEGSVREYVAAAIAAGFKEIGFADHIPLPQIDDSSGRMREEDFPRYLAMIEEARFEFPQITIRLGLEADYIPPYLGYVRDFISSHPFDYVIGSVHYIDDWNFDHPEHIHRCETYGVDALYHDYYALVEAAAGSALFDVIGHFDLPKKFGHRPGGDLSAEIEAILRVMAREGLALDVNTGGWRKPVQDLYPSADILHRACAHDVPIVFGSDAHHPREVGYRFAEAARSVREAGYETCTAFAGRKPIQKPF
jgi:histidinol-phosphatase (PHP family)